MISRDICVLLAMAATVASAPIPVSDSTSSISDIAPNYLILLLAVHSLTEHISSHIGTVVRGLPSADASSVSIGGGQSVSTITLAEETVDVNLRARDNKEEERAKREPLNPTNQCVIM